MRCSELTLFLIGLSVAMSMWSCEERVIEPNDFEYPLELTIENQGNGFYLSWTEVPVSTFEEYLVIRSQEPIDDNPTPEVTGLAEIAARIDEMGRTHFQDLAPPIATDLYYKVYARIGERFLLSPTVHVEQDLQLLSLRADRVSVDTLANEIIAYDRSRSVLFIYDYANREIRHQRNISFNNPVIRFGTFQGEEEIYIADPFSLTTISILDRSSLEITTTLIASWYIHDFQYTNDRFIVAHDNITNGTRIYRRNTLAQETTAPMSGSSYRLLALGPRASDRLFYEFTIQTSNKYRLTDNSVILDKHVELPLSGSQVVVGVSPGAEEFAVTNFGHILNDELETVAVLEDGLQFYQLFTYSDDGRTLIGFSFEQSMPVLKAFDVSDDYSLTSSRKLSFSPLSIFADNGAVYAIGVVFVNNDVRTLITKYLYS